MSLTLKTVVKGDSVTLNYQLKEDGSPRDITGMTLKFGVKEDLADAAYKIDPVTGDIDDAVNGKFSFALTGVQTDQPPFSGVYEIAMYDGSGNKLVLTAPRGVGFRLVEEIIG